MDKTRSAKFTIGQVVKHRLYPFRGVVFDIDPVFNNTEEWWQAIPAEIRPHKDQPFYHLFAENAETEYIAYVSEQNLLPDTSGTPIRHPEVADVFEQDESGSYRPRSSQMHRRVQCLLKMKRRGPRPRLLHCQEDGNSYFF
jgi:heat shock protein HspQ